jgi:hypothetical protein
MVNGLGHWALAIEPLACLPLRAVSKGVVDDFAKYLDQFVRFLDDRIERWRQKLRPLADTEAKARVQKLRHPDDVAGEEKQSLVDIKGFAGRCEFRLLHTDANEMLKAHCIGLWALGFGH